MNAMTVATKISKGDLIRFNFAILPRLRSTYASILVIAALVFGFLCWKNGIPQTQNNWIAIVGASLVIMNIRSQKKDSMRKPLLTKALLNGLE